MLRSERASYGGVKMSQSVDVAFLQSFNEDVHLQYQRMGSKLRGTIRTQTGVRGESLRFQKMGRGQATQKTRHGNIPPMNVDHSRVDVPISDHYGLEYCDDLDKLKINIEEQAALQMLIVGALGRKTDEQIVDAVETTGNAITTAGGMTRPKMDDVMVQFGELDVPDDGQRFCFVGWRQWADMMGIAEFVSADFVGDEHPLKNWPTSKYFNGIWWAPFSGLNKNGAIRNCLAYHRSAVGHAIAQDIDTEVGWVLEKDAWGIKGKMSMGAVAIDTDGIIRVECTEP